MHVLHGTWIPHESTSFVQSGDFYIWAETSEPKKRRKQKVRRHPFQLEAEALTELLETELKLGDRLVKTKAIASKFLLLPSADERPFPSPELSRHVTFEPPDAMAWQSWQVDCYRIQMTIKTSGYYREPAMVAIKFLDDLQFIVRLHANEIQLGSDLLFWHRYSQSLKPILFEDRYVPAIKHFAKVNNGKTGSKTANKDSAAGFYPYWQIVSETYEANLDRFAEAMPIVCTCGRDSDASEVVQWEKLTLLRHFSEVAIDAIITHAPSTKQFEDQLAKTLLAQCFRPTRKKGADTGISEKTYQQWWRWYRRLMRTQSPDGFDLGFVLEDPGDDDPDAEWELYFALLDCQDPSYRLLMVDYWCMDDIERAEIQQRFGEDLDRQILVHLGYAARMYPALWPALNRTAPFALNLSLAGAFEFLTEYAWVLEAAGFKAIVPGWWTPDGRRRAKLKLRPQSKPEKLGEERKSYFSADRLAAYEYQFAIGDETVEHHEWEQLLANQTPLVLFRGQWVELDPSKMKEMLDFWRSQPTDLKLSLLDAVKLDSQAESDIELDLSRDRALSDLMAQLRDPSQLEVLPNPDRLKGTLRDYQRRGLSWLAYLERLGLNGCLADDMGLGKTIQVIARLVQERETPSDSEEATFPPTLLVVPTSVVGNWRREIDKFAPHLSVSIHHGSDRCQDDEQFHAYCDRHDVIITSFTLARKDIKLLGEISWHRVVLDEAQNIKNPKTAQTKAILKLNAQHRLALTGTPVENRLMDLWSIFNFLNPGYLGKQTEFKRTFETPIQKHNDPRQAATLKKVVEPFILRRMKTDRDIIKDLPDKVEQKVYCNLTKEQAALYQTVVRQITGELALAEGMSRKGLILSSLTRLKQICNHPRQFLQDESAFTTERSHKLSRLSDMVAEAIAEGESLLIFTQFTELGSALEQFLRQQHQLNTYYLHGGTARKKREQMIADFQDPETDASAFILSLKAGGVGITLTKANHVFHFDRWWNPAVENQATDRAFRIGQTKNVFVHKFVAIGTLEERIDEMIEDKQKLAGAVVGSDESWLTELDNEAFQQLIALNASAVL